MAHQNIANSLGAMGVETKSARLIREGIGHMEQALRICPDFERARRNIEVLKGYLLVIR